MKNRLTNAFTGILALALAATGTAFAQAPYPNGAPQYDPNAGTYQGAYPDQGAYPPQGVYGDPNAPQEYSQYPAGGYPAQVYGAAPVTACGPGTVWVDGYYDATGYPVAGYCAVLPYTDAYWISPYWFGGRFYAGYWGHGGYLGHAPGWRGFGYSNGFRGGYRGGFNNGFRGPVNGFHGGAQGFRGTAPGFRNSAPSFRAPSSNGFRSPGAGGFTAPRGGNPAANSGIFNNGGARNFGGGAPRSGGNFGGGASRGGGNFGGGASHSGGFSGGHAGGGGGHAGGGSHGGGHR